jgi:A/G-specific adenine glycosylase
MFGRAPGRTLHGMQELDLPLFRRRLLAWYRRTHRSLPWRTRPTLYRTLVAEFMLQQTRVDQALPYYRRFLRTFPSLRSLAVAPLAQVIKQWEGLGYYRRAQMLHATAGRLVGKRRLTVEDFAECPGIGPYTLAAVASIVLGERMAVIDGNVKRVVARMVALALRPESPAGKRAIQRWVDEWIPARNPGTWNQALMELGATVCSPRDPDCARCPVQEFCQAYARGNPTSYPRRTARKPRPHRHIAAAVIRRKDGRILIAQRPADGLLPNLWEFPGGKQERGETLAETCRREIMEELGIRIRVGDRIARIDHAYSHYAITLHAFACRYVTGRPRTLGCQAWRWVLPSRLSDFPFPRANQPIIALLQGG